jgi:hypothetical protein
MRHALNCRNALALFLAPLIMSFLIIVLWFPAQAQVIYKTVDTEGNVSYSSIPPDSGQQAETIQGLPEPDPADVEAAVQRQEKIEEEIEKLEQQQIEQAERRDEAKDSGTTIVVTSNPVIIPTPSWRRLERHTGRRHPGAHPVTGRSIRP